MTELFGATAGIRQRQLDDDAHQLSQLAAMKDEVGIMSAVQTLQQQTALQKALSQGQPQDQPSSPTAIASNMDRIAGLAAQTGNLALAEKYATAGSNIRYKDTEIKKMQQDTLIKNLNLFGSLMDQVNDQQSWQKANATYQFLTGKPSPYAQMPYDPAQIDSVKTGVLNAKERALREAAIARRDATEATEQERLTRIPLIKAQTNLANERADALAKKGTLPLKPANLKAVTDLMTADFPAAMPEELRLRGREIAERAGALLRQNQGMTESEAVTTAYKEAKDGGKLAGLKPISPRPGTATSNPLKIPMDGDGKPDKSQMKVNMVYDGIGPYAGKKLMWTGTGFKEIADK